MSANKIGRLSGFTMAAALLAGASAAHAQVDQQIPLNYNWHGMAQPGERFFNGNSVNADQLTNRFRALQDRGLIYDTTDPNSLGTLPMVGVGGITYALFDSLGYANTTWPGAVANGYDQVLLYNKLLNGTTPEFFTNPTTNLGPFPQWAPQVAVVGFSVTAGLAASSPSVITVQTSAPHGLTVGNMVVIGGALPGVLNGTFNILGIPDATSFTIVNPNGVTTGSAQAFANNVPGTVAVSGTTLTFTAASAAHGLAVGNTVAITGVNAAGAAPSFNSGAYTGNFTVATVTSATVFTATIPSNQGTAAARMHFRTGATPFQITTLSANTKTVTVTTAATGNSTATGLSGNGTTVTATMSATHPFTTGQTVVITGAVPAGFNGTYVITSTPSATTLTYANTTPGPSTTAGAFTSAHGLTTGANVTISGVSPVAYNGTYTATVPSATLASIASVATTATATTSTAHPFSNGQLVDISGASVPAHNGRFTIIVPAASIAYLSGSGTVVTATTGALHSFTVGQLVHISGSFPAAYNGTVTIASVPSTTSFTYNSAATGTFYGASTAASATSANTFTYTIVSTSGTSSNAGINAFTPSVFTYNLAPQGTMVAKNTALGGFGFALSSLQGNGATVTAATGAVQHNLVVGQSITITNVMPASYNGTFTITAVPSTTTFQYADTNTAATTGTAIGAGSIERASIDNTTVLAAPFNVDANTQVGVLFLASNSTAGGQFDTVLTFNNGMTDTNFTARVACLDWCGNSADAPTVALNPIVSQTKLLHPVSASVVALSGDGSTITAEIGVPHGFAVSDTVVISGETASGYNGTYTVLTAPAQTPATIGIGGMVGNGATVTVTTAAAHGFATGQGVFISHAAANTGSLYTFNGTYIITVSGANTFTYSNPTIGTNTVAGSAVRNFITLGGAASGPSAGNIFAVRSGGLNSTSYKGASNTDAATNNTFLTAPLAGCANLGVTEAVIAVPAAFSGQSLRKVTFNNALWTNQAITSIVGNGSFALVTCTGHATIPGQTINITGAVPAAYNGVYRVAAINPTNTAQLFIASAQTAPTTTGGAMQRPGVGRGYSIHAVTARTGIVNQANASCATPMVVTTSGNIATVATNNFASGLSPAVVGGNDTSDVWFAYTAPFNPVPLLINTCTSQFDTTLAVYTSCGGLVTTSNDDVAGCGTGGSQVQFVTASSQTYLIRVAGKNGAKGTFTLRLEDFPAPANGTPQTAQTAFAGTGVAGDTTGTVASAFDGFTTATGGGTDRHGVWYAFTVGGVGAHLCEARTCLDGQDLTLTPFPQQTGVTGVRTVSATNANPVLPLDTTIAIYSGPAASPVFIAGNDDGCSVSSRVRWTGTPGVTYLIRVASKTPQAGTNAQFILHVDDPVHTDLVMPLQFNWNGINHGTTTSGPLVSEQTIPTADPGIGQTHENRSNLNGFRSIADRGLLFDPNNAVQNALNYGSTVGYQGMVYQMYDTSLQSDMVHIGNRNQTGGGTGRPWAPPGTTWPAQGGTSTNLNGLKPIWIGDDDQRGEQISSVTGLNATFGPNTQIGLLYHVSNVGRLSLPGNARNSTFDVTLRFADNSSVVVPIQCIDWFGGASAEPYSLEVPAAPPGSGKAAQRVLGIYRGVENTDKGDFAATGPLKVQEVIISTQELVNMGFNPVGRGNLLSIGFGNVVSGVLQPALNPPTPASVSITGNGTVATATFAWPVAANAAQRRAFFPGYKVTVANASDGAFNGDFKILTVPNETTITFECPGVGIITGPNITTLDNFTSAVGVYAAVLRAPATFNLNFPPSGTGTLLPNLVNLRSSGLLRVTTSRGSGSPNNITTVTVDASSLYGNAPGTDIIALNDSGSNGDVLANDNAWSRTLDLLVGTIPGAKVLPFTVTDAQSRTGTGNVIFTLVPPVAAITPSNRVFPGDAAKVTVNIGTNPPPLGAGSNITAVSLNLAPLTGGVVALNDEATNGDLVAADGTWSANFVIPAGAAPGSYNIAYSYTDASARVGTGTISLVVHRDLGTITHGASPNLYQQTYNQIPGGVRWTRFTLASPLSPTQYVDIDTEGTNWTPTNATYAALFDASGALIVSDTIDGTDSLSQLTFGNNIVARPAPGNGLAYNGRDGNLVAGTYFLAVSGPVATVTPPFGITSTSASTGPTTVRIVFGEAQFTSGTPTFNLHDFGTIPIGPANNPTIVSRTDNLQIGNVRWYKFTTAAIAAANRTFLDIDTEGSAVTDTIIAIFRDDGNGTLVAVDNDDGSGLYSQFSFGVGTRPAVGDGLAYNGRDGAATITAGTYYVCVAESPASFGNNFAVGALNGITTGNVTLTIRSGAQSRTLCGPITGNPDKPTDIYYLVDTLGMNWATAEAYAVSEYGGHLVTISSATDNQWVYNNVASCGGTLRLCWIGLSDPTRSPSTDINQRGFVWADGTLFNPQTDFQNWTLGEPNNGPAATPPLSEWYIEMAAATGFWNDILENAASTANHFSIVQIQPNAGACYTPSGACAIVSASTCTNLGGNFQGPSTTCPASGACCTGATCAIKLNVGAFGCTATGGLYRGNATTCAGANLCTGACCISGGCNLNYLAGDCATAGGVYQGNGSTCDSNNYPQPTTSSMPLEDISGFGTPFALSAGNLDDGNNQNVPIGFNFDFYGVPQTTLAIVTNGYVYFGAGSFSTITIPAIPSATTPNNLIAAYNLDLVLPAASNVTYSTLGAAPYRRFIVQWTNVTRFTGGGSHSFQIILYETANVIAMRYGTLNVGTGVTVPQVGVENSAGTFGTTYPGASVTSNSALVWQPPSPVCTGAPITGACTIGANCSAVTYGQCLALDGVYQGDSTTCPSNGACCIAGACTITTMAGCTGVFQNVGTVCSPNPCPPPTGACCVAGACSQQTQANCTGFFAGVGVPCTPNICPVCCRGSTCSTTVYSAAACTGSVTGTAGATYVVGAAATCGGANHLQPCCYADYNKIGGRNVTDIFAYLTDWFAARPWAIVGGSGTGVPNVSHIFAFLTDWFAGGCP